MRQHYRPEPPKFANRFLQWYCRPELLEEIQGDTLEIYYRDARQNKRKADWKFTWNVIRFFRWRNIRKQRQQPNQFSLDMLQNIFKVAIRNFFHQPSHSMLNVLGLSVSFTAAIIIGLWIAHEMSFDKFNKNPERIFRMMSHVDSDGSIETFSAARANIDLTSIPEIKEKAIVISGNRWPNELCFRPEGKANDCIYLFGIYSEESFFSIFNFPIVSGDQNPLSNVTNIAISETMASKLYGEENPIGKTIKIDDHYPVTIASVFKDAPANSTLQFDFVLHKDVFARMRGLQSDHFDKEFFAVYFKTNATISPDTLTSRINDNSSILTEDLKKDKVSYSAFPLLNARLHGEFINGKNTGGRIQYVSLFMIVAILVTVMAVINFVNLNTARAANRSKEIGIRKVTGAHRTSIVLQFMGEAFFVIAIALALSVICAQLSLPFFNQLIGETLTVGILNPSVIGWVVAFLIIVTIAAGLYPSVIMSSFQPAQVLKGVVSSLRGNGQQLRKVLLVIQVTASLGIIIFTAILFQQLSFVQNKNLGLDKENILHIEPTYKLLKQFDAFKNELLKHPQIQQVAATNSDPIDLTFQTTGVSWPGMPAGMNAPFKLLGCNESLLETFGISLQEGRMFGVKRLDSLRTEIVVSESAVKRMGLTDPLGTAIKIGETECVIIGVAKDFHTASLKHEQLPVILYSHDVVQCSRLYVKFANGTTKESLAAIEASYKKLEPSFAMKYDFVDDAFDKMYKTEKTASTMLVFFTVIAAVIAIIGVVGLATYNVIKRKKEIGVKRIFGASVFQVLAMLSKEFVILICVAALVGFPIAWYGAGQWLSGYAYRISIPWWIFGVALVGIIATTLLLILIQGLKTIRTNPGEILRNE